MSETAKVGQIWRRKKDGALIRIGSISGSMHRDCWWESVEGKKRGAVYEINLPVFYDLEPDQGPTA